jgi:dihydropteroate synthase
MGQRGFLTSLGENRRHGWPVRVSQMKLHLVRGLPRLDRPLVIGIVNVTPDSFSDGGDWFESASAVAHGLELFAEGADLVDVGGESTRPGAIRPTVDEELRRVLPVVTGLVAAGVPVSLDTMRAEVAAQAVAIGARVVNDVSGGRADPDMLPLVADLGVPYICTHWRGPSRQMQQLTDYDDVVADVVTELGRQLDAAERAGVAPDLLIADPGIGYAKTGEHNWQLLRRIEELDALDRPLLVGVSRKAFLGTLLADPDGQPRSAKVRDDATTALSTVLAQSGVWGIRVHAVRATRDAIEVVRRLGQG